MTGTGQSDPDPEYYVYREPLTIRIVAVLGWFVGWLAYWLARMGYEEKADALIDDSMMMRRGNQGAVRAIGYLNGQRGLSAIYRGRLMVHGKIRDRGPFANRGFYATYDVAAPNKARALALIRRFEWDAVPESLEIEEGNLDHPDLGAEGVLWIAKGRTFYSEEG